MENWKKRKKFWKLLEKRTNLKAYIFINKYTLNIINNKIIQKRIIYSYSLLKNYNKKYF